MSWEQRKAETMKRLRDPQYGDVFEEMYSVWMHVIARVGPVVVVHTLGGGADQSFGEIRTFASVEEFARRMAYDTNAESSPWTFDRNIGDKVLGYLHEQYLRGAA
jgi:hypothetical protein